MFSFRIFSNYIAVYDGKGIFRGKIFMTENGVKVEGWALIGAASEAVEFDIITSKIPAVFIKLENKEMIGTIDVAITEEQAIAIVGSKEKLALLYKQLKSFPSNFLSLTELRDGTRLIYHHLANPKYYSLLGYDDDITEILKLVEKGEKDFLIKN